MSPNLFSLYLIFKVKQVTWCYIITHRNAILVYYARDITEKRINCRRDSYQERRRSLICGNILLFLVNTQISAPVKCEERKLDESTDVSSFGGTYIWIQDFAGMDNEWLRQMHFSRTEFEILSRLALPGTFAILIILSVFNIIKCDCLSRWIVRENIIFVLRQIVNFIYRSSTSFIETGNCMHYKNFINKQELLDFISINIIDCILSFYLYNNTIT